MTLQGPAFIACRPNEAHEHHHVELDPARSRDMLDALGIHITREVGDEAVALCPMHEQRTGKADREPSWNFNLVTGLSMCFSCGDSANALGLVVDVLGLENSWGIRDYDAASRWLEDFELDLPARIRNAERTYQQPERSTPIPMTEARLAIYDDTPPAEALKARQIDQLACDRYGVLWDHREQAWICPLREPETGKLMGFQMKGQGHRLFRNRPAGIAKSTTLFGLDAFEGGTMIVVESPLDCLRLDAAHQPGAVATCGAAISERQLDLIISRADQVVLALDNPRIDTAGAKALEKFHAAASKRGLDFRQFAYGTSGKKDPGDMTEHEIRWAMDNAVHSIYGLDRLKDA